MKWYLFLFIPFFTVAQLKDCQYDYEEKNDSLSIKALPQKMMYEKVFGSSKKIIHFSLMQYNNMPALNVQIIEKNTAFIPNKCLDLNSKIVFQLQNGKFVQLQSISESVCSSLLYNEEDKTNIRVLNGYFAFTKPNYEELKVSPLSIMRIQFVGGREDFNISKELQSEISDITFYPETIFIDYLKCVE